MSGFALKRKKSKSYRELNAVLTIMARDIVLTFKSPSSLVMSLVLPAIMMGMLGGSLAQNITGSFGFHYRSFMLVGMLVNMLFMITTMGLMSLVEDRQTNFTQEMMISPVSRYSIVIGKIFGSTFAAVVGLAGTLIVGLVMRISIGWVELLRVLALSPLICLSAGALSMIIIGLIKNTRTATIVASFMIFPQMFLSGVIIPINHSSGVLFVLSRILPMTYCLDLTRAVVYAGTPAHCQHSCHLIRIRQEAPMARYSAQFRNNVLRKLLPPQSKSVGEVAREFGLSTATVYGWKAKMNDGTLEVDDGAQGARHRQLSEKFSLLLESRGLGEDELGSWLRDNGLHSEHLSVWEQEVREAMTKGEQQAREELREAKKQIKRQQKELERKEKALAELAAIVTLQKKTELLFRDQPDD